MATIGKTIRVIREARGMQLQDLARMSGVSVSFLSLVESGQRSPSVDTLLKVSPALSIPPDVLLLVASRDRSALASKEGAVGRLLLLLAKLDHIETEFRNALEPES